MVVVPLESPFDQRGAIVGEQGRTAGERVWRREIVAEGEADEGGRQIITRHQRLQTGSPALGDVARRGGEPFLGRPKTWRLRLAAPERIHERRADRSRAERAAGDAGDGEDATRRRNVPALRVRQFAGAVEQFAYGGRRGERRAARAPFSGDEEGRWASASVAIGGLPRVNRRVDADLPPAVIPGDALERPHVVEARIPCSHAERRDDRQGQHRNADLVADPCEEGAREHEASKHQGHDRGARCDVGGKERPDEGGEK